jgi:hypothetical protein
MPLCLYLPYGMEGRPALWWVLAQTVPAWIPLHHLERCIDVLRPTAAGSP